MSQTLGPLQQEFLRRIREYKGKVARGNLGVRSPNNPDDCAMCVLGIAAQVVGDGQWVTSSNGTLEYFVIKDRHHTYYHSLPTCFKLALRTPIGTPLGSTFSDNDVVAAMSDNGIPWPTIADKIESNPSRYFKAPR